MADALLDTLHDPHEDEGRRADAARALHHLGTSLEAQRGVVAWHSRAMGEGFAKIRGGGGGPGYAVARPSSFIRDCLIIEYPVHTRSFALSSFFLGGLHSGIYTNVIWVTDTVI